MSPEEKQIWYDKWKNLKGRAKHDGIGFSLTLDDYINLASEAGISTPNQIGQRSDLYCMGRIGDIGAYEIGNCRFITYAQNALERSLNGGAAAQAEKMRGRNKQNDEGYAKVSHTMIHDSKTAKSFEVTSPDGVVFRDRNMNKFCREHGLSAANLSEVCRGLKKVYKGWTGRYVDGN